MCESISKNYPVTLFNHYQQGLQESGQNALFCICKPPCTLKECSNCKRLIPLCYSTTDSHLCNFCKASKNWQNRSITEIVLEGKE